MSKKIRSSQQRRIFEKLSNYPKLIFAGGQPGYRANIVGRFHINSLAGEDRLDMGDGTNHVHVDWDLVAAYRVGLFHGEGMIEFLDRNGSALFKLYNPAGPFSEIGLENGIEESLL